MATLLDFLDLIGRATWQPVWIPLLLWTGMVLPLWGMLKGTDRLHPLAEYRLAQILLGLLPLGMLATALLDLIPSGAAVVPTRDFSVMVFPTIEATEGVSSPATAPSWQWTQVVGLLTIGTALASVASLCRLVLDIAGTIQARLALDSSTSPRLRARAARIARRLGATRPVQVCRTHSATAPFTLGGWQPIIVLPANLTDSAAELRMTLAHECIHIRRYDDLAHLLERLISSIFVAHPLVGRLRLYVAEARERACDAALLADGTHSPADYARLLLSFADCPRRRGLDALALSESPSALTNRLHAMHSSISRWLSSPLRRVAGLLVVGGIGLFGMVACSDSVSPDPSAQRETAASDQIVDLQTVDATPSINGGMQALQEQVQYPELAEEAGIEGKVHLQFVVDTSGSPRDVRVKRSAHRMLDSAAVHALRSVTFTPGQKQGSPVPTEMVVPITFRIPSDSSSTPARSGSAGERRTIDLEFILHDVSSPERNRLASENPVFQSSTRAALAEKLARPSLVRKAGINGTTEVTFTLGPNGTPQNPRVTNRVHNALDEKALSAVRQTTFATHQQMDLEGQEVTVQFEYQSTAESSQTADGPKEK